MLTNFEKVSFRLSDIAFFYLYRFQFKWSKDFTQILHEKPSKFTKLRIFVSILNAVTMFCFCAYTMISQYTFKPRPTYSMKNTAIFFPIAHALVMGGTILKVFFSETDLLLAMFHNLLQLNNLLKTRKAHNTYSIALILLIRISGN